MFTIEQAERLRKLPPYLFKEIDRMREEVRSRGVDLIDLGVGDPDRATPPHIVAALAAAAQDPANHRYPSYSGMNNFREAVAAWYRRKHGLSFDPGREVVTLIGSKEGLAHLPLAFINPGDLALVPEPAYPVYAIATMFAGGQPWYMPLLETNGFLPDLAAIPADVADRAKMIFVNYPNNPTGATAGLDFYREVVEFARRHRIIVVSDAAYSEMTYDGYQAPSFLEIPGAREIGIEVHSLSKTYNMTGWRIGWAVGAPEVIDGLGKIKSNIDSGAFQAVQLAGIAALEGDQAPLEEMRAVYAERRNVLVAGLESAGLTVGNPRATFYIWAHAPAGLTSAEFTARLLTKVGIVVTPGSGFGPSGEGYVRFALTQEVPRLEAAVERIKALVF